MGDAPARRSRGSLDLALKTAILNAFNMGVARELSRRVVAERVSNQNAQREDAVGPRGRSSMSKARYVRSMPRRRMLLVRIALLALPGVPSVLLAHDDEAKTDVETKSKLFSERRMPSFRLRQPSGRALSERDFVDRWTIVFFGYTSCPDICPTTMTMLTDAFARLGRGAEDVSGLFVTVDPRRDTDEVLSAYMANFSPRIVAGTGTLAQVEAVVRAFGMRFEIHGDPATSNYTVDHPAVMLVFDPHGYFVSLVPHGASASELTDFIGQRLRRDER